MKTIDYTLSNNQVPEVIVSEQKEDKKADVRSLI